MKLAEYESGFDIYSTNTKDPGGSYGLFQVSNLDGGRYGGNPRGINWTVSETYIPENNVDTAIAIHEVNLVTGNSSRTPWPYMQRIYSNGNTGKGIGGSYAKASLDKVRKAYSSGKWPSSQATNLPTDPSPATADLFGSTTVDPSMQTANVQPVEEGTNPFNEPIVPPTLDVGESEQLVAETDSRSKAEGDGPIDEIGAGNELDRTRRVDPKEKTVQQTNPNPLPGTRGIPGGRAMGMTSTLNDGNHVWVKFENGDPLRPVVIGSVRSQGEMGSIRGV